MYTMGLFLRQLFLIFSATLALSEVCSSDLSDDVSVLMQTKAGLVPASDLSDPSLATHLKLALADPDPVPDVDLVPLDADYENRKDILNKATGEFEKWAMDHPKDTKASSKELRILGHKVMIAELIESLSWKRLKAKREQKDLAVAWKEEKAELSLKISDAFADLQADL